MNKTSVCRHLGLGRHRFPSRSCSSRAIVAKLLQLRWFFSSSLSRFRVVNNVCVLPFCLHVWPGRFLLLPLKRRPRQQRNKTKEQLIKWEVARQSCYNLATKLQQRQLTHQRDIYTNVLVLLTFELDPSAGMCASLAYEHKLANRAAPRHLHPRLRRFQFGWSQLHENIFALEIRFHDGANRITLMQLWAANCNWHWSAAIMQSDYCLCWAWLELIIGE